jgi:hypothetical protein
VKSVSYPRKLGEGATIFGLSMAAFMGLPLVMLIAIPFGSEFHHILYMIVPYYGIAFFLEKYMPKKWAYFAMRRRQVLTVIELEKWRVGM